VTPAGQGANRHSFVRPLWPTNGASQAHELIAGHSLTRFRFHCIYGAYVDVFYAPIDISVDAMIARARPRAISAATTA
jgi:hypothetical protein